MKNEIMKIYEHPVVRELRVVFEFNILSGNVVGLENPDDDPGTEIVL